MSKELPSKPLRDLSGFKELKSFSVYVNLFSRTKINGITRSVFKIIVEDNISHHKFIGYSFEKSRNSIDIFVSYVLSHLAMRDKLSTEKKITSGSFLNAEDFVSYSPSRLKSSSKTIQKDVSHKEIIQSIYSELIMNNGKAGVDGYFDSSNPILPPLFVDSFIGDINKVFTFTEFWKDYSISDNFSEMYKEALLGVINGTDRFIRVFDFQKALSYYNNISRAAIELTGSEKISALLILKKAKIFFHLEEYFECRDVILRYLEHNKNSNLKDELGEMYFYLGLLSLYINKSDEAEAYLLKASRILANTKHPDKIYVYYLARVRRFLLKKNYNQAIVLINKAIRFCAAKQLIDEISCLYGTKAEIFYRQAKYSYALDNIHLQIENAEISGDLTSESKGIAQLFQIYTYWGNIEESKAKEYLRRLKFLSGKIKKRSYYYDSVINLGVFYYRLDMSDRAEKYFNKAALYFTKDTTDFPSHIVNMIYLAKIRISRKKYLAAVRLLNKLLKFCCDVNIPDYNAYIENALGRIYSETGNYLKSNIHMNRVLKYIRQQNINDGLLLAHTYKLLGTNYYSIGKLNSAVKYLNISLKTYNKLPPRSDGWLDEIFREIRTLLKTL